jgi:hypothetical protein
MTSIASVEVDVKPNVTGLAQVARIIEHHLGALAHDLEQLAEGSSATPVHEPGDRPPRY